jgi:hypothetical protein
MKDNARKSCVHFLFLPVLSNLKAKARPISRQQDVYWDRK